MHSKKHKSQMSIIEFQKKYDTKDKCREELFKMRYQANVNTLIGSLRDKLADAVFSRNPAYRQKKLERIMTEIQKSVVQISNYDGETPRFENTRKVNFHHNKRSNL